MTARVAAASSLPTLYDYQSDLADGIRAVMRNGGKRILLVCPTGSGKGTLATWMVGKAVERGRKVVFLVNRRELVKDLSRRLDKLGLDHGVVMGSHWRRKPWCPVQVASIDTLHRRNPLPPADLLFLDEAHFSISPIWKKVIDRYSCPLIGMTATPVRADGRGLGDLYDDMLVGPSVAALTARGFLVPARIFAPPPPDLTGVKTIAGDYNQGQLARACDKTTLIGDVVEHWARHGRGRPTVAFAVNVEHSEHIAAQFNGAGVRAVHVDANTPDDVRDRTWRDLAEGRIQVCSSVGVISYGWDVPPVSCAILARPTQSLALFLQQIGRVLRTSPGKADALVLDHAGNVMRHGFPDDEQEWTLDSIERRAKKDDGPKISVRTCKECWFTFAPTTDTCPACGWTRQPEERELEVEDGELLEVTEADRPAYTIRKLSANPRIAALQQEAAAKGYKTGWVFRQARRIGAWR